MVDYSEKGENNVICVCTLSIPKKDWQDHQIVCTKRRYTCPAYVSFISSTKSNEYSLSLVDSNCPLSLKEIAKSQALKSDKINCPGWLESNKIPYTIIHTLRKECPIFENRRELIKHIENTCPYWKVNCFAYWKVNHLSSPETILRNCHKEEKCPELSRQEFLSHSTETAYDPISQRIRAISKMFPYYCKSCDQHLPSSDIHICINETNPINAQVLCPGCKSMISVDSNKLSEEIENTCANCRNNRLKVGLPGMTNV